MLQKNLVNILVYEVLITIMNYNVRRFGLLSSQSLNDNSSAITEIIVAVMNVTFTPLIIPTIPSEGIAETDIIVMKIAVPIAPAICLNVLFIAVPCAIKSFGNWLIANVVIG